MSARVSPKSSPELGRADYRLLVESVEDYAIFILDPEGNVATWNAGAERIKGFSADEIVGRHFSVFYPAQDVAAGKPDRELAAAREHGRVEDEGWRIRKDGSRFWANVTVTALHDASGTLVGFGKVTRDLTERRAAEEKLRRSEERFRLLVEGVGDYAIYMLDPQGHVTTWNRGAQNIKGYAEAEILGAHYSAFFTPEDVRDGRPGRELAIAAAEGRFENEGFRVRRDGSQFWASAVVTALRGPQGDLLGFAKVTRDLTSRQKAERYRDISRRLEAILEGVADGITVQDRTGRLTFANRAAAQICGFTSVEELLDAKPGDVVKKFEMLREDGTPFPPDELPGRRVLAGAESASAVMRVRERATGVEWWSFVRASGVLDAEGQPDLAISIFHDVTAERRREEQERYLDRATAALGSSLDRASMLSTLASLLVPGLADWCSVHLLEGTRLAHVAVAHVDPAKVARAREYQTLYPPEESQPRGVYNVVRTGQSELYPEIGDELIAQAARDARHLEMLREVGMRSLVVVPIRVRDRILGTIALVSAESGRRYDAADLALAEELGRRAGTAVENARLYAAEKRARERLELLARASEAFSSTLGYEDVLWRVVDVALPALGDFGFFDIVEGSEVRRIAAAHEDAEIDALVKSTRWVRSERTDVNLCALSSGESAVHPAIDDAWMRDVALGPEHLEVLRRLRLGSMVSVPLRWRGEMLGALTLCFGKSGRHHVAEDLKLAEELARRAASAVVHARLYEEARASARRAEEASRIKDEFLATVSHELRTPLNAILGWAALLRGRVEDASVANAIEVIHRNAQAQGRIVDDILDVSRIITGKLRLELQGADLVAIVRDALEVVGPSAAARAIEIDVVEPEEPALLVADPARLQQVVWNLLSNAVKFTDRGGRITVTVEREGSSLVVSVSDTGQGIAPDLLPFVFDRFKQADSSTTRRVGGLGLGLAIVKHIVELHGGQAQASSDGPGKGATFTISVPVRAVVLPVQPIARSSSQDAADALRRREAALQGLRVLVVDDDTDARELLREVLAQAGAAVETSPSAQEGLERLRAFRPHVLVSDVGMPDEDGYAFMQRVRALDPDASGGIPSIALTAYTRGLDKTRALAAGFTTHIGKPVDPDELLAMVGNLARLSPRRSDDR